MQRQNSNYVYLILVLGLVLLNSCEKSTLIPDKVVGNMSFKTDISPILKNCGTCHSGSIPPNFTTGIYESLKNGNFINGKENSVLYKQITTKDSHISKTTPEQKAKILLWLQQGALNN